MLRAILNWLKSLLCCCFPKRHDKGDISESTLLLDDDELAQNDAFSEEPPISTTDIIVGLQQPPQPIEPVKLSTEESALILHYAQLGENKYIDGLSEEKQKLAFNLIDIFLKHQIRSIDRNISEIPTSNSAYHRIKHAWQRIRTELNDHDQSEFSMMPSCEDLKKKQPGFSMIADNIMHLFNICKNIVSLRIFRAVAAKEKITAQPSKEEIRRELLDEEPKYNRRTLELVNNFNKRIDETEAKPPRQPRRKFG